MDLEGLAKKAEEFAKEHADQIDHGVDKAAELAEHKFGHADQIEQGADKLKGLVAGGPEKKRAPAATPRRRRPRRPSG